MYWKEIGVCVMKNVWFAVLAVCMSYAFVGCSGGKPKVDLLPAPPYTIVQNDAPPVFTLTDGHASIFQEGNGPLSIVDPTGAVCELPSAEEPKKLKLLEGGTWEHCAQILMEVEMGEHGEFWKRHRQ
jgi:hypothetical protein